MTLEELKLIPLQYTFGYSADSHGLRQYVNQEHQIAKQVYTPRKKGQWCTGTATYMLLDTKEEFDNINDLLEAINRREEAK